MRAFHDELLARYSQLLSGEAHLINKMKEIWTYMSNFFKNSEKARKRVYKTHSLPRYLDAVRKIFDEAGLQ
jgi:3'-phosphoadenosine 5'-phosphosulfate sulfotransferase (PAPS reductase)/FAD synthetase